MAVNSFFWPDGSATSQRLTDLAEHLASCGHRVTVVTSRSRPDRAELVPPRRETRHGVAIHRVWTSHVGRRWPPGRAIDDLSFYAAAFLILLLRARAGDTILAKAEPPLVSVVAWIVARLKGASLVNWCQDLHLEIGQALGVRVPALRLLRFLRNRSLCGAATNVVLCGHMAEHLRRERVPAARISVIHNWADRRIRVVPREANPLRHAWGLTGQQVIGYSGTLGPPHLPGSVLQLVRALAGLPDLCCLFIGGGAGMKQLQQACAVEGLGHVLFRPYRRREDLSSSLCAADLHLVSLDPTCEGLIMPSKLYGVLAAGRPILALAAATGAVAELVRDLEVGEVLPLDDPDSWRGLITGLARDRERCRGMGERARAAHERWLAPQMQLTAWTEVLERAASLPRGVPLSAPSAR